ncbi:MAG: hypothetical protein IJ757_09520 [Clostridiales bacterium]|nr:hypothetical protein [Clostridiales bacterium]
MKKYITAYMNEIKAFIANELDSADGNRIREVLSEFETKIAYFQHERLIHLIVTVLFALLEMMSVYTFVITLSGSVGVFCVMFLVLLVPYVMHYYFLENSVQEMYKLRDRIVSKLNKQS